MRALSINQPWAWCIANGYKGVENRDWNTCYRGEFLIHAGKKIDKDGYEFLRRFFPTIWEKIPSPHEIEIGGIVGKAKVINCVHEKDAYLLTERDRPWFFGKFGFILNDMQPINFKPCKGALGFFNPDYNSRYVEPTPEKR